MMQAFFEIMDVFSQWTIPLVMLIIILWGAIKKVPMYESFVTGAKEGFDVAVMIIPYLVAILFVIKVFMASGVFEDMKWAGGLLLAKVGLDGYTPTLDLLPLALTRPLTGGGAQGVLVDLFDRHHPDSFLGQTASLMMGSTETTFYVLTVYFGAVNVKKLRHTLPACLIADGVGIVTAIFVGYLWFGG